MYACACDGGMGKLVDCMVVMVVIVNDGRSTLMAGGKAESSLSDVPGTGQKSF